MRSLWLALATPALVVVSGAAYAEQWQFEPTANLETGYDDNVRLTSSSDAEAAPHVNLDAGIRAIRMTEVSDVRFALGLAGNWYSGVSDLDNTSGFAGLDLGYRLERHTLSLGLSLASESTLTSEVATTGLVQVNRQQNTFTVGPAWSYLLSERARLNLAANYQQVYYEDVQDLPLYNYRLGSVDFSGSYSYTERLALTGRISYGRYETQGPTNDYENVDLMGGANYQLSATTSLSALFGLRRTEATIEDVDQSTNTQNSSGPTYALRFSKSFEAGGGLSLEARRDLMPSGSAEVLDTTGLAANLDVRFRPRWQFLLAATAYRNRQPDGDSGIDDRTYASVEPGIGYVIDESWRLAASYRFRWEDRNELDSNAVSNAIYLSLNWTRPSGL